MGHFGTELKKVQLPETPLKRLIGFRTFRDTRWNRLVRNFTTHPGSSSESDSTRRELKKAEGGPILQIAPHLCISVMLRFNCTSIPERVRTEKSDELLIDVTLPKFTAASCWFYPDHARKPEYARATFTSSSNIEVPKLRDGLKEEVHSAQPSITVFWRHLALSAQVRRRTCATECCRAWAGARFIHSRRSRCSSYT